MTRPAKPNPTPKAPFNLRVTGPMSPTDIYKKLGQGFRVAHEHGDPRATTDADPCPHCGAAVEWTPTTHSHRGKVESYVYARCQGKAKHAWGLSSRETKAKRESETPVVHLPPTGTNGGAQAMHTWIDQRIAELEAQIRALVEMRRLMGVIDSRTTPPVPRISPS